MFFTGIDWGVKFTVFCIIDSKGKVRRSFQVNSDYEGFTKALEIIRSITSKPNQIEFAIESDHPHIVDFLMAHGFTLYLVNPNSMDKFRDRYKVSGAKSDSLDAFVLANVLRTDRLNLRKISKQSELTREISILVSDREKLVREKVRLENQLIGCLREYFPLALEAFKNVSSITALDFLEHFPTYEDAHKLSKEELHEFLKERHCYSHKVLDNVYKAIKKKQVPIDKVIARSKPGSMLAIVTILRSVLAQINKFNNKLKELLDKHPDSEIFRSLPGADCTLASKFISCFGDDRTRFNSYQEPQALSGVVPITVKSGNYEKIRFRFACSKFFRNTIHIFAFCSITKSLWAKSYYHKKRSEGKTHNHALRCLDAQWMKIIFAMWKNNKCYDENSHLANIAKHRLLEKAMINA